MWTLLYKPHENHSYLRIKNKNEIGVMFSNLVILFFLWCPIFSMVFPCFFHGFLMFHRPGAPHINVSKGGHVHVVKSPVCPWNKRTVSLGFFLHHEVTMKSYKTTFWNDRKPPSNNHYIAMKSPWNHDNRHEITIETSWNQHFFTWFMAHSIQLWPFP